MYKQEYASKKITEQDKKMMAGIDKKFDIKEIREAMEEWELEQEKKRELLERMRWMVISVDELLQKYHEFGPFVKDDRIILSQSLPAGFICRYIFDCNSLGFKGVIDSTGECSYNATH